MTKEELAQKLNGREYTKEMTNAEEAEAKAAGLIVIFGASDDLCELRGAINDELGAYKEAMVLIDKDGNLLQETDDEDISILDKYGVLGVVHASHKAAAKIMAHWCATPEYSWTYETTVPHATFDVVEDDGKYCRGIVIDMKDVKL